MKIKGLTNCAGPGFSLSANQTMLIDDETGRLLVRDGMAEEVVEDTDPNAGQTDDSPKEDTPDDSNTETTTDPAAGKSETPEKGKGKKVETATVTPPAQTPEK